MDLEIKNKEYKTKENTEKNNTETVWDGELAEVGVSSKSKQFFDNLVWMTSEEAAQYLRKSVGALRTAVCRGQIDARKWRRRLYFRRTDLDRLLDSSIWKRGI